MSDPTDPDTFEEEVAPDAFDVEAPEADAAEQYADIVPRRDEPLTGREISEADAADAAEQRRVVDLDEDDYRE